jgi:hypothetical protein
MENWMRDFPQHARCALHPLGSVRGPEGLNIWEYIAFSSRYNARYIPGDRTREQEENRRFCTEADEYDQEDEEQLLEDLEEAGWNQWITEQEETAAYFDALEEEL